MVPVTALWYRLRLRFKHMRVGRDMVDKSASIKMRNSCIIFIPSRAPFGLNIWVRL
jgi:hypothetical protein